MDKTNQATNDAEDPLDNEDPNDPNSSGSGFASRARTIPDLSRLGGDNTTSAADSFEVNEKRMLVEGGGEGEGEGGNESSAGIQSDAEDNAQGTGIVTK